MHMYIGIHWLQKVYPNSVQKYICVMHGNVGGSTVRGLVDDGQTNYVSFDTICLAVECRSEPVDNGLFDDGQTNSVCFDTICLAVKCRSEPVDIGLVDDGQTNSVSFDTICLAVNLVHVAPSPSAPFETKPKIKNPNQTITITTP